MRPIYTLLGTLGLTAAVLGAANSALAQSTGKTANGCSYEVINGKYFYNCPTGGAEAAAGGAVASTTSGTASAAAAAAPIGSYPQEQKQPLEVISPSLPRDPGDVKLMHGKSVSTIDHDKKESDSNFGETTYAGVSLGATNFLGNDTLKSSATAYGVQLGTNVSDYFGLELGYSYAKTELFLGLEQRSGGRVVTPRTRNAGYDANPSLENVDSALTAHVINAEGQFFLTHARSRFRPFGGLGLAYKSASLKENFPVGTTGASNSSLEQTAFGATAAVGAKFRISDSFQVAAAFRFLIPISTSDPEWGAQPTPPRAPGPGSNGAAATDPDADARYYNSRSQNLFQGPDSKLTSSALSQLFGTVQYIF